jgi:hypothetical protein
MILLIVDHGDDQDHDVRSCPCCRGRLYCSVSCQTVTAMFSSREALDAITNVMFDTRIFQSRTLNAITKYDKPALPLARATVQPGPMKRLPKTRFAPRSVTLRANKTRYPLDCQLGFTFQSFVGVCPARGSHILLPRRARRQIKCWRL